MMPLLLMVEIAGEQVALRVSDVQSVIELELLAPAPRAPAHVVGLSTLRSRVLTVIDCQRALGLDRSPNCKAGAFAAVVVHDGHHYALLIDSVSDVAEGLSDPAPVAVQLGSEWASMSHGMVDTAEGPRLLINVGAIIAGPQKTRAA